MPSASGTSKRTAGTARSIQGGGRKPGRRSHTAILNDRTLKSAHRHGMAWDDQDVERLVAMIASDEHTIDMALALQRSFYAAQVARSHIGFVMRHQDAFDRALAKARRR